MTTQLELGAVMPKVKRKATEFTCKCGCVQDEHANARHSGKCARCGDCRRFRPKKKPPVVVPAHLGPPNGAIILERDDTKRAKTMGWASVSESDARIYLSQLKTRSLNKSFFGGKEPPTGKQWRRMYAWQGKYKDACRERTTSAIAQCGVEVVARGRPSLVVVTRVSPRTLDKHDNVRGAMKFVVDGIAAALGFDDSEFEATVPLRYEQEKSGAAGVCGVRVQLTWEKA
jgi:hypothetical protein